MRSLDSRGKVVVLGLLLFLTWILPAWGLQNLTSNSNKLQAERDKLVSPSGHFELGIFRLNNGKFYLCIRYAAPIQQTVVWVHREQPLTYAGSYLKVSDGALQLFDQDNNTPPWSSNTTNATVAKLLDAGNLVLEDDNGTRVWNSFNYSTTDTLLPGQYLIRTDTRQNSLTSWASRDDPSTGTYTFGWGSAALLNKTLVPNVLRLVCQTCTMTNAAGAVYIPAPDIDSPHIISNADSVYFHPKLGGLYFPTSFDPNSSLPPASTLILSDFQQPSNTTLRRLTLDRDGGLRIWEWQIEQSSDWIPVANWVVTERGTQCFAMRTCGDFSLCQMTPSGSLDRVQCTCLEGFQPKDNTDLSRGCNAKAPLSGSDYCPTNKLNFTMMELVGIDMPWGGDKDLTNQADLATCKEFCLNGCNCTGVVYSKDEQRCWRKYGTLYNLGYPTEATHGNDRVAIIKVSNHNQPEEKEDSRLWIIAPVLGGVLGAGILVFCICRFRRSLRRICGGVCTKTGPKDHGIPEHFGGSDNDQPQQLGSH